MFTVTVQVLEPETATLRLYQLLPFAPADSVAVQLPEPPPPPPPPHPTAAAGRAVADGEVGVAGAATPGLSGEDLVVERAEVHPVAGPRVEDVLRGDRPAGGVSLPDRQVLLEGAAVARNAGLVDLLVLVEVVRGAIAGRGAHEGAQRGATALVVLDDVVLDQRVGGPAVE